jgi:hypothetical protein
VAMNLAARDILVCEDRDILVPSGVKRGQATGKSPVAKVQGPGAVHLGTGRAIPEFALRFAEVLVV